MKRSLVLLLCFFAPVFAQNFSTGFGGTSFQKDAGPNTTARLIAERDHFVPGETLWLGVELRMKPHWHTYWINPGDSGMPTTAEWELPAGFEAGEFVWPTPQRFLLEGLVSFGYENKVVLRVPLQTPRGFPVGGTVSVKARVDWLECKDVCLPGSQEVALELRAVAEAAPSDPAWQSEGAVQITEETGVFHTESGKMILNVETDRAYTRFFPIQEGVLQLEPAPELRKTETGVQVFLTPLYPESEEELNPAGVLVDAQGAGFALREVRPRPEAADEVAEAPKRGVLYYLGFAFIAGMGMNLLPCIFPVPRFLFPAAMPRKPT
ncbi:MAG: protein-disulfide reductase DsbD domain-containing protein [Kiritimatiellia bacterium]